MSRSSRPTYGPAIKYVASFEEISAVNEGQSQAAVIIAELFHMEEEDVIGDLMIEMVANGRALKRGYEDIMERKVA